MSSPGTSESLTSLSHLRQTTSYLTGHDKETGDAIIQEKRPGQWQAVDGDNMAFNVVYTTSAMPPSVENDVDIATHDKLLATKTLGLVNKNGTVLRIVDFAPGYQCMLHRTASLDYGIVLEGQAQAVLEAGESPLLNVGDVVVQRGTNHAWRNPSKTQWMRMIFVLQDAEGFDAGTAPMTEDLEQQLQK